MSYVVQEYGGYVVCDGCGERIKDGATSTIVFPVGDEREQNPATECEHCHPRCFKVVAKTRGYQEDETVRKS